MANVDSTTPRHSGNFDRVARLYEPIARIYSLGQIEASKASQLPFLQSGDRVLYAGVGSGEDAYQAAQRGVELTCIDLSGRMLDRLRKRLDQSQLEGELIQGDLLKHARPNYYDAVAANFFLNCFRPGPMRRMLRHLTSLVRPGGRLMIADIAVPSGNTMQRGMQRVYNGLGIGAYWLLGLVPLHPIYDYRRYFNDLGLELESRLGFHVLPFGPPAFESITALKSKNLPSS